MHIRYYTFRFDKLLDMFHFLKNVKKRVYLMCMYVCMYVCMYFVNFCFLSEMTRKFMLTTLLTLPTT